MSRVANDPDIALILEKLTELLIEINDKMLYSPKGTKLPTQKELGVILGERFHRIKPFSDHAINTYMKMIKYKSNRKTKQYEKEKTFTINGYVGEPSLVYLPVTNDSDREKIKKWTSQNFPLVFEDSINSDKGILLIGNTNQFAHKFIKLYDAYAKENNVRLTVQDLEEPLQNTDNTNKK